MSFQGYLTDTAGTAIDVPQDLTIKLYDVGVGGSSVWARTYAGVPVTAGLFEVILENGTPSFSGLAFVDSLWIEVEVAAEVISPRTRVTASPYARGLSLPVEAEVDVGGTALMITNTRVSGTATAVYGTVRSTSGQGVFGSATRTSGSDAYGVHGKNAGSSGRGVYGLAISVSGGGIGVAGLSNSESGLGVLGVANHATGGNFGVRGQTSSASGWGGFFDGGQGTYTRGEDNNAPDLVLGGSSTTNDDGRIFSDPSYPDSDIWLQSGDAVVIVLDHDKNGFDADFVIQDSTGANIFNVDESGVVNVTDTLVVDGSVKVNGVVEHGSDRNRKDDIVPVDVSEILNEVALIPISRWRYKGQPALHVGPMAQDFFSSFGLGSNDTHIATVDADGVALAAIQGLYKLVEEQQAQIDRMQVAMERAGIE